MILWFTRIIKILYCMKKKIYHHRQKRIKHNIIIRTKMVINWSKSFIFNFSIIEICDRLIN